MKKTSPLAGIVIALTHHCARPLRCTLATSCNESVCERERYRGENTTFVLDTHDGMRYAPWQKLHRSHDWVNVACPKRVPDVGRETGEETECCAMSWSGLVERVKSDGKYSWKYFCFTTLVWRSNIVLGINMSLCPHEYSYSRIGHVPHTQTCKNTYEFTQHKLAKTHIKSHNTLMHHSSSTKISIYKLSDPWRRYRLKTIEPKSSFVRVDNSAWENSHRGQFSHERNAEQPNMPFVLGQPRECSTPPFKLRFY
jgi:hypothetical protein